MTMKRKKHPITIAYGYRARGSDVRHIFYSATSSSSSSSSPLAPSNSSTSSFWFSSSSSSSLSSSKSTTEANVRLPWSQRREMEDALVRKREKKRRANEWEWLFASAADRSLASRSSSGRRASANSRETGVDELNDSGSADLDPEWSLDSEDDQEEDRDDEEDYDEPEDGDEVMEVELDMFSITTPSELNGSTSPGHGVTTRRSSPSAPLPPSLRPHPHSPNALRRQPTPRAGISSRLGSNHTTTTNADSAVLTGEREFSSCDIKTKRAAFYRGRSASRLPRPPEWLGTHQDRTSGSPSPCRAS